MVQRRYYSQHGEDLLLWSLFGKRETGFFVDVGAFDGIHYSNSLSFEQAGWEGICVEAHPDYFPLCRQARPGSICVFGACVGPQHPGRASLLAEPLGLLSGIGADRTPKLAGRYARRGMTFPGFTPVEVPAMSLDEIVARHRSSGSIDFLSVDVEGTELDVLQGFSGRARVIVVEANTVDCAGDLLSHLARRGYVLARKLAVNLIFVRDESDARALRAADLRGTTEHTLHPLGSEVTLQRSVGRTIRIGPVSDEDGYHNTGSALPAGGASVCSYGGRRRRCLKRRMQEE